jgi:hypothetical protein
VKTEKRLEEGYREMASDTEHEREAAEWCEALISDSSEATQELFDKLDKLNSESANRQPVTLKSDVFE